MFLSEAGRILSSSPAVFVASSAQETEKDISPAERELHRLHVSGGHVSKTSLRLLLQLITLRNGIANVFGEFYSKKKHAGNKLKKSFKIP